MKQIFLRLGVMFGLVFGLFSVSLIAHATDGMWPYNYNNYNYRNYNYGLPSLSQTSVSITVGQSVDITIYGGNAPYTMYPSGTNIFQAVISGNNLQIAGLANGSGSVNVCSSGGAGSGCVVLYVTVNPVNYYGGNYYNPPIYNNPVLPVIMFSQTNPTLSIGQSLIVNQLQRAQCCCRGD